MTLVAARSLLRRPSSSQAERPSCKREVTGSSPVAGSENAGTGPRRTGPTAPSRHEAPTGGTTMRDIRRLMARSDHLSGDSAKGRPRGFDP